MIDKMLNKLKSNPITTLIEIERSILEVERAIREFDLSIRAPSSLNPQSTQGVQKKESTEEGDCISYLMKGLRELEYARTKVDCPVVREVIDDILSYATSRMEGLTYHGKKVVEIAEEVLKSEGVEDWNSLSEEEKKVIKEKIKEKIRGEVR